MIRVQPLLRDAGRIARHEWGLVLREPRLLVPFVAAPLLLAGMHGVAVSFAPPGSLAETASFTRSLLLLLAILAPSLSIPLSADSFAGERERKTLEILLCLPISLPAIFWGKVFGVLPFPMLAGWLGQAAVLALAATTGSLSGLMGHAAKAWALVLLFGPCLCAFACWVSLRSESVRGAAQVASLVLLVILPLLLPFSDAVFSSWTALAALMGACLAGTAAFLGMGWRRFLRFP